MLTMIPNGLARPTGLLAGIGASLPRLRRFYRPPADEMLSRHDASPEVCPCMSDLISPLVDGRYWAAMFAAGLFGTVTGDLLQHVLGIYTASTVLCLTLAGLILARGTASRPMVLYWAIVMAERCAGTAVGDALASHQAVNLGLPLACVCTGGATLLLLWMRGHAQSGKPRGMGAA